MDIILQPIYALRIIFSKKVYFFTFIILVFITDFLLYFIPVKTIPGNSIGFQLQLMGTWDYIVILLIAVLKSVLFMLFYYIFRNKRKKSLIILGKWNLGILSGIPRSFVWFGNLFFNGHSDTFWISWVWDCFSCS